ncbi:MAG: gliding motility-associated C-terminal domain-containing protein [Bacteroidia bacterium]|nr:gliding motility-associated C-terminal domain-containing protein [Bacteroidia bacterium]
MRYISKKYILFFLMGYVPMFSQTISPYVINTCGGEGITGGIVLQYNVGETFVSTINNGNHIITQGFLQPDGGKFNLLASYTAAPISCVGKEDGSILLNVSHTGIAPQHLNYEIYWSDTLCPSNNCYALDSLSPGTYSVMIVAYDGTKPIDTVVIQNIVILSSDAPCKIKPFTYISPNNDGQNDYFYIDNIEEYPENKVQIFNRWGQEIISIKNYDNQDNAWGSKKHPIQVPGGTYYYIIDLDNKGKNIIKGFLEIIK